MPGVLDEIEAIGNRDAGLYGVPTGFVDLDDLTNGLHPGQMIIVAARPVREIHPGPGPVPGGVDAQQHGQRVLQPGDDPVRDRHAAALRRGEGSPLNHIRNGNCSDDDWNRLARKMAESDAPRCSSTTRPNMTMMEIRAKARRLKQRHDLRLIVIDYMQLMTSGKKVESRQLEVSEFSRQIKLLAKELEVPIIALSQLNRGPEQRTDKRPMLSDLRESGSLEQDSDMVILLHREDMYERESPRAGEADLIVAKHRNGPTRDITVAFQGHYSRFVDMAH